MTNVQLYFAIGIPTFTVLCSLMIGIFQLNHVVTQLNARFTSLESNMNARSNSLESNMNSRFAGLESKMNMLEGDIRTLVKVTNEFDVRLARLEERLAR